MRTMSQRGWAPRPPGPRLSSPRERERNAVMAIRVGVNMLQFCSLSNSLSHTTLSIKWEVYFSKDLCLLVFIVSSLCFCMHLHIQHSHHILRIGWIFCASGGYLNDLEQITTFKTPYETTSEHKFDGLVFLFNSISTFLGNLMPNPSV